MWTELKELIQEEETHTLPECPRMVESILPQGSQRVDFPRCNNDEIDWYMKMQTDPPQVDPKVETLSELCEEEGATLEPTFPMTDSQLPH